MIGFRPVAGVSSYRRQALAHLSNPVFFSALLPERFLDEFSQIQAILERYGIAYRLLNGTKDICSRDYMPIQISEKDFVQFRYEPSYLKTDKDLLTRSYPRLVNLEHGLNPAHSGINLDGGNVVRYKEKVMITARVFKENQNSGLSEEEISDQLGKELRAHVIIKPKHPADQIDLADGNVRFH